jgi:spore coat polysaccharide biosynthesis protein SpsF (cytidylyltransferase family)
MFTAIIQAREGSKRYPNKMIEAKVGGKPLLIHIIGRLKKTKSIDNIVVAIPKGNNGIIKLLQHIKNISIVEGSEDNVLQRFVKACKYMKLNDDDWILRICGDAPFPEPLYMNYLASLLERKKDYYDAAVCHGLPKGREPQAFTVGSLRRASNWANQDNDRVTQEHIDPLLDMRSKNGSKLFRVLEAELPHLYIDVKEHENTLGKYL